MPRTAKQPKDESTEQARVKSSFWRQIGKRCVCQSGGQQICGESNTGGNIHAQPVRVRNGAARQKMETLIFHQAASRAPIATADGKRSPSLATSAFSVFDCPRTSSLERITALLALDPRFESLLINRQLEDPWPPRQFPENFSHFARGAKDDFVHGFRFALASIGVEVDPESIWAKHEHACFRQRIVWPNAGLRHQKRSGSLPAPRSKSARRDNHW